MVIFDLDGTLYRTHETSLPPLYELCRAYGICLTQEDEKFLLSTTTRSLLDKVVPQWEAEKRERFARDLKRKEIERVKTNGRLYEGVEELLSSLSSRGIDMAICGMGSREYIDAVLDRCNIRHFFKYISYRIEGRSKGEALCQLIERAHVSSKDCIMVGDSITDLSAANQNEVPFIGVSYGYGAHDFASNMRVSQNVKELQENIYRHIIFLRIESDISPLRRPLILGINGVDTSGKTFFSESLSEYLEGKGYHTQIVHLDDFHNPKEIRLKDDSPQGYLNNAFDLDRLKELLLVLKSGANDVSLELLNLDQDTYTNVKKFHATKTSVIIVEGVLLYRPPIDSLFDYRVFLKIGFDDVLKRAKERDVPRYGKGILERYKDKYIPAQKIYLEKFKAEEHSQLIINNTDYRTPLIVHHAKI